jgi:hypothetical protein
MINEAIKPGDVWASSWGYDQTNVDFYRVIRTTKTMVVLEAIAKTVREDKKLAMQGTAMPVLDSGTGREDCRRKVHSYDGSPVIEINSFICASPWDGSPQRVSWYC